MSDSKFIDGKGVKVCPSCGPTRLWSEGDTYCDICLEAGAFYNAAQDGEYEMDEAERLFMEAVKTAHPSLTDERLQRCWEDQ